MRVYSNALASAETQDRRRMNLRRLTMLVADLVPDALLLCIASTSASKVEPYAHPSASVDPKLFDVSTVQFVVHIHLGSKRYVIHSFNLVEVHTINSTLEINSPLERRVLGKIVPEPLLPRYIGIVSGRGKGRAPPLNWQIRLVLPHLVDGCGSA